MNTKHNPYLSVLNDRIASSETVRSKKYITPDDYLCFVENIGNILDISTRLNSIPIKREVTLNVLDFDDTIYSRHHQLQLPILQDNRGLAGNEVMERDLGYENVLEKFYNRDEAVQRLLGVIDNQTQKHRAMILTAGLEHWQNRKCRSVGINKSQVPIKVVPKSSEKPRQMIEFIIQELGFIPGKIIIYEDRPEYFLETSESLSKVLGGVEIVVDKVTLSQHPGKRQISEIEQVIFSPTDIIGS